MQVPEDEQQRLDARRDRVIAWLRDVLEIDAVGIVPASADASFRRYFRVQRKPAALIVMDAPPDKEDVQPWLTVAGMLERIGVNAPRVLQRNLAEGFLLITDLGSRTYLAELEAGGPARELYDAAIDALVRIQARGAADAPSLPPYDEALLRREMALFPEWFLGHHLEIAVDKREVRTLADTFTHLVESALSQPRVFVHRDYHSRNLMVCGSQALGPTPGILDFQDAVYGPVTYDLVSLLRDCYVAWPSEQVLGWVDEFRARAAAAGIDVGRDAATFVRWFDLMGVQRHLKAIGIFARLWHRDGKMGYLKDIPRTLNYVFEVASTYPELNGLATLIERRVLPKLESA